MKNRYSPLLTLLALLALLLPGVAQFPGTVSAAPLPPPTAPVVDASTRARVMRALQEMPLLFIENRGQADSRVAYYVQGRDTALYFTATGVTYALADQQDQRPSGALPLPAQPTASRWAVALDFLGANPAARPQGEAQNQAVVSYFKGCPEEWHTGLPTYERLIYRDLWPGIDLVFYGTAQRLKYEFLVHPGADAGRIRLGYRGVEALVVDEAGRLVARTPLQDLVDEAPVAYQDLDGQRVAVAVEYDLPLGGQTGAVRPYGFRLGAYDPRQPLVLDPAVLVYCGYIGGSGGEEGQGIAVDGVGNAYVTGGTAAAPDFPAASGPGYDTSFNGGGDVFVAKLNATGTELIYATFLGGAASETGYGIAVDGAGQAYVTGSTRSPDFPAASGPGYDTCLPCEARQGDAFVVKLNAAGTGLIYAAFLGEAFGAIMGLIGRGIAVDGAGQAYVTGVKEASPATELVFVAKVNPTGTGLIYAKLLGGHSGEESWGLGIAVDGAGNAYVTGYTESSDFPAASGPGYDTSYGGGYDAFVVKLSSTGELIYATFLGGAGGEIGQGIAVDGVGQAYVTGCTSSSDFPAASGPGYDTSFNGGGDVFVAKLNATGTGLIYATFLGGAGFEIGYDIAVDGAGNAYVTGYTNSTEATFPVTVGPDLAFNGILDAFVAQVSADGTALAYCGYIGGSGNDYGYGIAVDGAGNAYVTGYTNSTEATFPVTVGPDLTYNDNGGDWGDDTFVAKVATGAQPPAPNRAPGAPADLRQLEQDGVTTIPAGGTIWEGTVVFRGRVSDPDGDQVKLQIELRRLDESLSGTPTSPPSDPVSSGEVASIRVFGLIPGEYHWQARTAASDGSAYSSWVRFDNPILACDFRVVFPDLRVTDIKPIQTIEDVPLIKGKETMVRVSVDVSPQDVPEVKNVRVAMSFGGMQFNESATLIRRNGELYVVPDDRLQRFNNCVGDPACLKKLTFLYGLDAFNFGDPGDPQYMTWSPTYHYAMVPNEVGTVAISAIVDPADQDHPNGLIMERFEGNNAKILEPSPPVKDAREYKVLFQRMSDNGSAEDFHTIRTEEELARFAADHFDYLLATYPLPSTSRMFYTSIVRQGAEKDADRKLLQPNALADMTVYVVPQDWMKDKDTAGFSRHNIQGAVIVVEDRAPRITAHEVGHTYGLKEEYETREKPFRWWPFSYECGALGDWNESTYPYGYVAGDGWDVMGRYRIGGLTQFRPKISLDRGNPALNAYNHFSFMGDCANCWAPGNQHDCNRYDDLLQRLGISPDPRILLVRGWIREGDAVEFLPFYSFEGVPDVLDGGGYSFECLSGSNEVLSRADFEPFYVMDLVTGAPSAPFSFRIEFPDGTERVRLVSHGAVLKEIPVTPNPPSLGGVTIHSTGSGTYEVVWNAADADGGNLTYSIFYSHNGTDWSPLLQDYTGSELRYVLDVSDLPGGDGSTVKIVATDGVNTTEADTGPFAVPNKAPFVSVSNPPNGSQFSEGNEIRFEGIGYDPEESQLNGTTFVWASDLDGVLGVGKVLVTSNLSLGKHTITLSASDTKGLHSSCSVEIRVTPETRPDPSVIAISSNPPLAVVNQPVLVTAEVFNDVVDAFCEVAFYDGDPAAGGVPIGVVPCLAAANAMTPTSVRHTFASLGEHDIHVVLSDCRPEERDLSNDSLSTQITAKSPPWANADGPYIGSEGSPMALDASGSNDQDGQIALYEWDVDNDGFYEARSVSPVLQYTWDDEYAGTIVVRVTDNDGLIATATTQVTVDNAPPTVGPIAAPADPVQVNTRVNASANFTDPGVLDTHTAVWTWDDGSTSAGTVNETNGAGSVAGSHIYTIAGVYTVKLAVTDDDGGSGQAVLQYVVAYDPLGGFVTGGGWINSPAGAYVAEPALTGKANFGFVSKYQKGASLPTGNTEFQFKVANLNFHSESYEWLVVAGAKAMYKGMGTINGAGEYKFMLSAIDGQISGGGGVDRFRIKIWDKATGNVVYDNQIGVAEDAAPTTAIGGGSIVIHK